MRAVLKPDSSLMAFTCKVLATVLFMFPACSGFAILTEYSATANALSGITMLSDSPADFALSPIVEASGVCASWHKPFGNTSTTVYGLHSAYPLGMFTIATGLNYLNHPDYRWQDEYLALGMDFFGLKLGATQHYIYEKIQQQVWSTWDNDFAVALHSNTYGTELRWNSAFTSDSAITLTATSYLSKGASASSAYTWRANDADSYSVASSYSILEPLTIHISWQSTPARFGAGFGLGVHKLFINYAVRTHTELSLTHFIDIGANW